MNGVEDGPVEVGDDTPPIKSQAAVHGWACDFFNFGKAEQQGLEFFNPGLVRRPDGLWLLVRRSELFPGMPYGRNGIWACKLDNERKPLGGPNLKFPDSKPDEQFEDPRGVYWNNQTWIGCVNFTWYPNGQWTGAHQMIGVFQDKGGADITQETWTALARRDPIVGSNKGEGGHTGGKHNKNLLWWFVDNKLHCLYTSDPWRIVEFGSKWDEQVHHIAEGVIWKYGVVRGGTPPVLVGDLFYTFFHSSLPWRGRYRRYYMGAIAFEARPPFKPVLWTQEPLLIGSQNDRWHQRKPLVVFPCGAVMENNKWLVSLGVNDLKSAWIEIPHDDLKSLLADIPVVPGLSLLSDATTIPVYEPVHFEEPNGGDANCNVTAEVKPQIAILAGAKSSDQSITQSGDAAPTFDPESAVNSKIDLTVLPGENADDWAQRINSQVAPGRKPGRPRKDGLPQGSVPKPKRKYRKRRKKKALKSQA